MQPFRQLLVLERFLQCQFSRWRPRRGDAATASREIVLYPSGLCCPIVHLKGKAAKGYSTSGNRRAAPLVNLPPQARLSPRFLAADLCPPAELGHLYARISPALVVALEGISDHLSGHGLRVVSGYRPPSHNRANGCTIASVHLDGLAADIRCDDISLEHLYDIACEVIGEQGAVYLYPDQYVHVDVAGAVCRGVYGYARG